MLDKLRDFLFGTLREVRGEPPMLQKGSIGPAVLALQSKLGVTVDGIFGEETNAAVVAFQNKHSLVADGIVGPTTRKIMGL